MATTLRMEHFMELPVSEQRGIVAADIVQDFTDFYNNIVEDFERSMSAFQRRRPSAKSRRLTHEFSILEQDYASAMVSINRSDEFRQSHIEVVSLCSRNNFEPPLEDLAARGRLRLPGVPFFKTPGLARFPTDGFPSEGEAAAMLHPFFPRKVQIPPRGYGFMFSGSMFSNTPDSSVLSTDTMQYWGSIDDETEKARDRLRKLFQPLLLEHCLELLGLSEQSATAAEVLGLDQAASESEIQMALECARDGFQKGLDTDQPWIPGTSEHDRYDRIRAQYALALYKRKAEGDGNWWSGCDTWLGVKIPPRPERDPVTTQADA